MKVNCIIKIIKFICLCSVMILQSCGDHPNNPYPNEKPNNNALYSVFTERPKHLDPALSFNENEAVIVCQVYEPPLQYAYLTRPFTLVPLSAAEMPTVRTETVNGKTVSTYTINIKPGIYYQPHPAFAKDPVTGKFLYHNLSDGSAFRTIADFPETGTRELVAEDFVYQIKRLADPKLSSPIYGLMADYIVGLRELSQQLRQLKAETDLRLMPLSGAKAIDKYTFEITIYGEYPQFLYWLTMPFFSPMPWEAITFYSQPVLKANNVSLDWYPVGTGPFMMQENNPNLRMMLVKNPNFHGETFPTQGDTADIEAGFLKNAGKPLPLLDSIIFTREKETIPYWAKFLQGYYDRAAVNSDNFDQALKIVGSGDIEISEKVQSSWLLLPH